MYLIYGTDSFLIEKEIKKLSLNDIVKYDLKDSSIENIIDDANMSSLFCDKKNIVISNAYIFSGSTNKKLPKQNLKVLEEYFKNENECTTLVFILNNEKIDSRKKITSLMKKSGNVIECNQLKNVKSYVKDMIKPYNISEENINLLINRVGNDLSLINNEIEKIKIYKNEDTNITREDIINLTHKNINTDIFVLIDNIILQNKESAIVSLHEMIKYGTEPIAIIIMVANQIRIMYQAKKLIKQGYSEYDIASILEIHEYRVKKALEKARSYDTKYLLYLLDELANIDYQIKSGLIDKKIALDLFILQLKK